jgi:hypothetical protein
VPIGLFATTIVDALADHVTHAPPRPPSEDSIPQATGAIRNNPLGLVQEDPVQLRANNHASR